MILNGTEIISGRDEGRIHIEPYNQENVGPNSYDITLGNKLLLVKQNEFFYDEIDDKNYGYIDPKKKQNVEEIQIGNDGHFLYPGVLYLAHTQEEIGSDYYVPMLEGRSSIGRMGLFIHVTAGFGDIGFKSQWTLELMTIYPIRIYPGMRIGQVFFHQCSSRTMRYDGRYTKQSGPQESLYWQKRGEK
jgi:dCTP deaminase